MAQVAERTAATALGAPRGRGVGATSSRFSVEAEERSAGPVAPRAGAGGEAARGHCFVLRRLHGHGRCCATFKRVEAHKIRRGGGEGAAAGGRKLIRSVGYILRRLYTWSRVCCAPLRVDIVKTKWLGGGEGGVGKLNNMFYYDTCCCSVEKPTYSLDK